MWLRQAAQGLLRLEPIAWPASALRQLHQAAGRVGSAPLQRLPLDCAAGAPAAGGQPALPAWPLLLQLQQHARYATDRTKRAYIPSRKPAIKKPAPHQWHFCSIEYDPAAPLPKNLVPPYAPEWAHDKDYTKPFKQNFPRHGRNRYRRGWRKNRLIALQRWQQAWQRRLAEEEKVHERVKRLRQWAMRRVAWKAWRDWRAAQQQREQQPAPQLQQHTRLQRPAAAGSHGAASPLASAQPVA